MTTQNKTQAQLDIEAKAKQVPAHEARPQGPKVTPQNEAAVARAEVARQEENNARPVAVGRENRDRPYADRYRANQQERQHTGPQSWAAHSKLLGILATALEGRAAAMQSNATNPNGEQINNWLNEAKLLREIESELAHGPFDPYHHSVPRDQRGAPTGLPRENQTYIAQQDVLGRQAGEGTRGDGRTGSEVRADETSPNRPGQPARPVNPPHGGNPGLRKTALDDPSRGDLRT